MIKKHRTLKTISTPSRRKERLQRTSAELCRRQARTLSKPLSSWGFALLSQTAEGSLTQGHR